MPFENAAAHERSSFSRNRDQAKGVLRRNRTMTFGNVSVISDAQLDYDVRRRPTRRDNRQVQAQLTAALPLLVAVPLPGLANADCQSHSPRAPGEVTLQKPAASFRANARGV